MNTFLSLLLSILICSIISIQLTSSASFPNPPQFPPPNASPDEWTLFVKLLHNYYAIIARPRFGKRYDSPLLNVLHRTSQSIPLSENEIRYTLSGNNHDASDDQQINVEEFYTLTHPDRRRR